MSEQTFEVIEAFVAELKRQEISERTIACYRSDLRRFDTWLEQSVGEEFAPETTTPTDVRSYRSYLQSVRELAPATINRKLAALRKFFRWAQKQELVTMSPVEDVAGIESVRTAPRALSRVKLNRLTREAEKDAMLGTTYGTRNLAIIQVLRHTGMRVGELAALKRSDVEISERQGKIIIRAGKGNKYREVALNSHARKALTDYLEVRPDVDDPRVFISQRGGGLTPKGLGDVVKKYAERAGLVDVTAHVLRHSFAYQLRAKGVRIEAVNQLLGHERLQTTMIYTQPTQEELAGAVEKLEAQ